jgi:hypothetical protein
MSRSPDVPQHVSAQRLIDFTEDGFDLTEVEWAHIQNCPECREAYSGYLSVKRPQPKPTARILQFRPKDKR